MSLYATSQDNPEELARTAFERVRSKWPDLGCCPHNRFDTKTSTWWIGKRGPAPHYKNAKLFFAPARSSSHRFETGFLVEKGYGPAAKEFCLKDPARSRAVMDEDWRWPDIVGGFGGNRWREIATSISGKSDLRCRLRSEIDTRAEEVEFAVRESGLLETLEESNLRKLKPFANARSLEELGTRLLEPRGMDWHWIDLWLWSPIGGIVGEESAGFARAAEERLVDDLLIPYLKFV